MMFKALQALALLCALTSAAPLAAQEAPGPIQALLQEHAADIAKPSRRTIQPVIDALAASELDGMQQVLQSWEARSMYQREADGWFFAGKPGPDRTVILTDFDSGEELPPAASDAASNLKPNSGVRGLIASALVRFQLLDDNAARRQDALTAIARTPDRAHLEPLAASIDDEPDPELKAQKQRLLTLLTISYGASDEARIAAIESMAGDLGVDTRATLNPLVATTLKLAPGDTPPASANVARTLRAGSEALPREAAYDLIAAEAGLPARISPADRRAALQANVSGGAVGGVPLSELNTVAARERAYEALEAAGAVAPAPTEQEIDAALAGYTFYEDYAEPSAPVTEAARDALRAIDSKVGLNTTLDLGLDALSLASIYFLAAIGLAITFGVMGVINMAHGEFIMMGAYTGYVVQQVIPNHTVSILVAIPLAFAVTFAAGVAMERLVIRWLYNRPLETLLATFGISIALQQLAKNIFGTQARPLTAPSWLDGQWQINEIVAISNIRVAIFVLALVFLCFFLFLMKKTRLGLETRAVTQNPRMAASMGINPGRVNMLTFGLGSGIAGIAGVAIGLYAKVTSELGSDYIVQSFMTVVVGGVGNIWGTLLGATMIGSLQKGIEWLNPSNTLAAQTYMIIFIIIFIQFRPRGIIALKGRAAGD
ncbi:urea ABC transporter permease subunit UrtB [Vannielia litorea]|uniref:Amino acid/amide ABC transporter membrane protein 1, HAAT family n=1 Tax=Vannielia litorea TaxID=1217970 RepID=A0A1N6E965_9RHOB|nr:urea ABC transporter permease subunit UrtB [Vannielia litorea]SIN79574.1 amino acid/amide ABC transporter membrane protein 1, HAAT family [Vannielia litorea]